MHQSCLFGCQDFLPYVSVVTPPLLQSSQLKPDVTITSTDSNVDIDESDDESIETITLGDKRIGIRTSVLEEKATSCNMLCCYADELKEGLFPWVDQVAPTLVPLLKFYFHEEVRKVAVSAMPKLLRSAKLAVEKGQTPGCDESYVKQLSDYIIPSLVEAMHKNYYNVYGGVAPAQYPQMYGAAGTIAGAFYLYYQTVLSKPSPRRA